MSDADATPVKARGPEEGTALATQILKEIGQGDPTRAEELLPLVYEELRKLARYRLAQQSGGQTLQATALVHEAYLRIASDGNRHWDGKRHFFAAAAESMRRIVIDRIRKKAAVRHGGHLQRVGFEEGELEAGAKDTQLMEVHEALEKLQGANEEIAQLVKLRFFVGLSLEEAGEVLGMSERTIKRRWTYARAWLYKEMRSSHTT